MSGGVGLGEDREFGHTQSVAFTSGDHEDTRAAEMGSGGMAGTRPNEGHVTEERSPG